MPETDTNHKRKRDSGDTRSNEPRKKHRKAHSSTKESHASKPSKDKGKSRDKDHKGKEKRDDTTSSGSGKSSHKPSSSAFSILEKVRLSGLQVSSSGATTGDGQAGSSKMLDTALAPLSLMARSSGERSRQQTELPMDTGGNFGVSTSSRKQTVDGVSDLRMKLQKVEKELKRQSNELEKLKQVQKESEEIAKLSANVIASQAEEIAALKEKLVVVDSTLLKLAERKPLDPAEEENVSELRKTILNKTLGAVMYKLIGVTSTEPLPEPLLGEKEFWTKANEADESFLRPKFDLSFTNNGSWHRELLKRLKQNGAALVADFATISSDVNLGEVKKRMSETVYKNMQKKWKNQQKPQEQRDEKAKEEKKMERKAKKAAAMTEVREQFSDLQDSDYDFMFNTLWQSTDTDRTASDGDNELSDTPANPAKGADKKRKKRVYWLACAPNFRSQKYIRLLKPIRKAMQKTRNAKDKNKPSYVKKFTERRRGSPKVADELPDGKKSGLKTPKWAVSTAWRIEHPYQESWMTGTTQSSESEDTTSESSSIHTSMSDSSRSASKSRASTLQSRAQSLRAQSPRINSDDIYEDSFPSSHEPVEGQASGLQVVWSAEPPAELLAGSRT